LIPRYSYYGASFATVATEAFGLAFGLFFLGRYGYSLGLPRASLSSFFGLSVIGAISALLFLRDIPLVLITIIDLVAYTIVIYKFGLNGQDKQLILSLLKSFRPAKAKT
jgi:hypothetical protein